MTRVKALFLAFAALALLGALGWQFWLKDQTDFVRIATGYGAKQVCSCRFVAGRDMASCRTDFLVDLSAVRLTETDATIRAGILGGLIASEARFTPGLGCTLTD